MHQGLFVHNSVQRCASLTRFIHCWSRTFSKMWLCQIMRLVYTWPCNILFVMISQSTESIAAAQIATPDYNFYIITGPNMGGKTIYIKMIPILQIMAQLGCFVPAKSAQFRITDRIFCRMGFNDSLEQNASSFIMEVKRCGVTASTQIQ